MINFNFKKVLLSFSVLLILSPYLFSSESKNWAWLDSSNQITVYLANNLGQKVLNGAKVKSSEGADRNIISIEKIKDNNHSYSISLDRKIENVGALYTIDLSNGNKVTVIPRNILDSSKYVYNGEDLGFSYTKQNTTFKLWDPIALGVAVKIYDYYNSSIDNFSMKQALSKMDNGVWQGIVTGDLKGKYYLYEITEYYNGKISTKLVLDPYTIGASVNDGKNFIYDKDEVNFYVPGWDVDKYVQLKNPVDAVLYELHVRDYSIDKSFGGEQVCAGKFVGLTQFNTNNEKGLSTGLNSLLDLGVTHIQLMPTTDFGAGDEAQMNSCYTWYSWGNDPILFNVPDGSFATSPNGLNRYIEFKTLLQTFHSSGIGVIMDVVLDHTYAYGDEDLSVFDKIVPYYYYHVKNNGEYVHTDKTSNELATERPMVRKFLVDTLKNWARTYHVDGFRIENINLLDKETITDIYIAIKALNPSTILYGAQGSDNRQNISLVTDLINSGVGVQNSGLKYSLLGTKSNDGYLDGNNDNSLKIKLKKSMGGQVVDSSGAAVNSNSNYDINYLSIHNTRTLFDILNEKMKDVDKSLLKKKEMLAMGVLLTSQGVPMIGEGDEFSRTKQGKSNTDNNNDPTINPVNWNLKNSNMDLFTFCSGLIKLRKEHPGFRMIKSEDMAKHLEFFKNTPNGVLAYALKNNANSDKWKNILVAFNNTNKDYELHVVGTWHIVVCEDKSGTIDLNVVTDKILVAPYSMIVAYSDYDINSFEFYN